MNNNFDKNKIIDAITAASGGKVDKQKLTNAAANTDISSLISALSPEDQKKLTAALSSKEATQKLLQSNEAKAFLNAFLNGGKSNKNG